MLPLIPWLCMTIGSAVGWKLGSLGGTFTGAVLAIVGTGLGFYYGRKLKNAVTP